MGWYLNKIALCLTFLIRHFERSFEIFCAMQLCSIYVAQLHGRLAWRKRFLLVPRSK